MGNAREEAAAEAAATLAAANQGGQIASTPLMVASRAGDAALVQTLVDAGAIVDERNSFSMTALSLASAGGHEHAIRVLLSAGAAVGLVDVDGHSALSHASFNGRTGAARVLVAAGAPLSPPGRRGSCATPLAIAQEIRHAALESLLVAAGAAL